MTSIRSAADTGLPVSRPQLERMIEDAISILEILDGDTDLEENGDLEPSIGTCFQGVVDAEMDKADDEPSLGSFDRMTNQSTPIGRRQSRAFLTRIKRPIPRNVAGRPTSV